MHDPQQMSSITKQEAQCKPNSQFACISWVLTKCRKNYKKKQKRLYYKNSAILHKGELPTCMPIFLPQKGIQPTLEVSQCNVK